MADGTDPMATLASAIARSIGMPIDPAFMPGVSRNLSLLYEHAAKVQAADLPAASHQAPIYRP
jgi:Protein of unknown function (DUF4089)